MLYPVLFRLALSRRTVHCRCSRDVIMLNNAIHVYCYRPLMHEARFHFNRIVAKRSVNSRTELLIKGTIEYATFRYDTVEVKNGLEYPSRSINTYTKSYFGYRCAILHITCKQINYSVERAVPMQTREVVYKLFYIFYVLVHRCRH